MDGLWPVDADISVDAEQVLHALADVSDDAIICLDGAGRVLSWNRSAVRIFGFPVEDVIGQPSSMLFPEHVRDDTATMLDQVIAGLRLDRHDAEIARRDGMPVPVSLTACPVFGRAGRAPAAVVLVRDVTEQRLAQASLAEVEERLREAERLSQTGSWLWDRRTGSVQWSDGLHRIHGRDPLEFDGTFDGHLDSVHPADREALRAAVAEAVASGHPLEQEYRVALTEDGARWVHTRAEPTIGSDGTVVGLRGIAQDVTGERRDAPS